MDLDRIYVGDSRAMEEVDDNSIQLIVTSPPYNVGKDYNYYEDHAPLAQYLEMLMQVWRECERVLVPGGRIGILTRGYPDAAGRHVPSFWIRVAALAHDFAESVCEGWQGFSDVEESNRLFTELGFRGASPLFGGLSFLQSSLWLLTKA